MKLFNRHLIILLLFTFYFRASGEESLFPQISGWKLTLDDIVYDGSNLWDAIDGAADLYLEYNFESLTIGTYLSDDGVEIKAEIYKHNTENDAFGIYSQERDPKYNFIDIGSQGYLQTGVLNFLTGRYYIKLSTHQINEQAQLNLKVVASEINKHLKQTNKLPQTFRYFSNENKIAYTEVYVAHNFLGYDFLNNVYTVNYKVGEEFKIFLIEFKEPAQVDLMLARLLKILPEKDRHQINNNRYFIVKSPNGPIELLVVNRFLCGIINCMDEKVREHHLNILASRLSN